MRNSSVLNGSQATAHVVTRSKDGSLEPARRSSTRYSFYRFRSADKAQIDATSSQLSSDCDDNIDVEPVGTRSIFDNSRNNTHNNTHDHIHSQISPIRPRRRTATTTAAAAVMADANAKALRSPFGEAHNRRNGSLRRARTSGSASEKSRKRRSIEKPAPEALHSLKSIITTASKGSQRPKPRFSAPSRIPAPVKSPAPVPVPVLPASTLTPERPQSDSEGLVKLGEDSLKKLSIGSSPMKPSNHSPTLSPPSPSIRKPKMMESPFHRRQSSDLLEAFFLESPEQPKFQALPLEFRPHARGTLTFQRQVSHAHVLFGGPAIESPTPDQVPLSSSQSTPGDEDDDEFFNPPSPAKLPVPQVVEPAVVKKFKPRDSGVVVSDDSEAGSPIKRPLLAALNFASSSSGESIKAARDRFTPSTRSGRRSSEWAAGMGLTEKSGGDQTALKVLFNGASGIGEKHARPRTPVKRSSAARMFSSVPRGKATLAPPLATKGRKSMPNSRFDLRALASSPSPASPEEALSPTAAIAKTPTITPAPVLASKPRPTILIDFMRRCESGVLPSASSSADSLSAQSSVDSTPTRYKVKGEYPSFGRGLDLTEISGEQSDSFDPRRGHGPRRTSHRLHVVQGLFSNNDEEGRFENQFQVLGELGHGQFGVVLKVNDRLRNLEYAVKKSGRYEGIRHRNRLREEVDVLKALTEHGGHTNVLEYVDSWDEDDHLYIQTVLCPMGNLATFLNEYGKNFDRLDEAYVWKIMADVADGLNFIHSNGFIHLDLKPANIFVADDGRLRIGDFGMASTWPRQVTGDFEREGDREYMAPEILRGIYGKAADMFSLGMVILEAAANIVVPDMGSPWHKLRQEEFSDVHFAGLSGALVAMIRNLMRTDPGKRVTAQKVCDDPVVGRARAWMAARREEATKEGLAVILGSPLAEEREGFVRDVLGVDRMEFC